MANYYFPEDLDSDEISHFVRFFAYNPGETSYIDSISTFMPGGGQNGMIGVTENFAYEDVRIMQNLLGAVGVGSMNIVGMAGKAINPKVEVLFRHADLRNFRFDFLFAPSSEGETKRVKDIIQSFRKHAHPTLINAESNPLWGEIGNLGNQIQFLRTGGLYQSPSEFIIKYYNKNENGQVTENKNLPLIGRSVMTGIEAIYTPDGMYSTFTNGYPVSVRLSMEFREMRIIDRKNVEDGF